MNNYNSYNISHVKFNKLYKITIDIQLDTYPLHKFIFSNSIIMITKLKPTKLWKYTGLTNIKLIFNDQVLYCQLYYWIYLCKENFRKYFTIL